MASIPIGAQTLNGQFIGVGRACGDLKTAALIEAMLPGLPFFQIRLISKIHLLDSRSGGLPTSSDITHKGGERRVQPLHTINGLFNGLRPS